MTTYWTGSEDRYLYNKSEEWAGSLPATWQAFPAVVCFVNGRRPLFVWMELCSRPLPWAWGEQEAPPAASRHGIWQPTWNDPVSGHSFKRFVGTKHDELVQATELVSKFICPWSEAWLKICPHLLTNLAGHFFGYLWGSCRFGECPPPVWPWRSSGQAHGAVKQPPSVKKEHVQLCPLPSASPRPVWTRKCAGY